MDVDGAMIEAIGFFDLKLQQNMSWNFIGIYKTVLTHAKTIAIKQKCHQFVVSSFQIAALAAVVLMTFSLRSIGCFADGSLMIGPCMRRFPFWIHIFIVTPCYPQHIHQNYSEKQKNWNDTAQCAPHSAMKKLCIIVHWTIFVLPFIWTKTRRRRRRKCTIQCSTATANVNGSIDSREHYKRTMMSMLTMSEWMERANTREKER